jgi:hypothetical protein
LAMTDDARDLCGSPDLAGILDMPSTKERRRRLTAP